MTGDDSVADAWAGSSNPGWPVPATDPEAVRPLGDLSMRWLGSEHDDELAL